MSEESSGWSAPEGFDSRVIGIVATWIVSGLLGVYLELWSLIFGAADQLSRIPAVIQSDLEMMWWVLLEGALFPVIGAFEGLLVVLIEALGPAGWIVGMLAAAGAVMLLGMLMRLIIRVIPVL